MSTIATTIYTGITLGTGTYTSPLTITSTGAVEATSNDAIHGDSSAAWTIVNFGTVETTGTGGDGIDLRAGGSVTNTGAGLIKGSRGVFIVGAAGTVTNAGTILGTSGYGLQLFAGGSVDNTGTGLIEGSRGVFIGGGAGTVTNAGTILGTGGYGVRLPAGGSVDNTGTGLIEGSVSVFIVGAAGTVTNSGTILGTGPSGYGVRLNAGGTVVDSGTISGAGGVAVSFGGSGANLLALGSGYQLTGVVAGSTAGTDTLELLGTAGNAVTVDYEALGLTSFEKLLFGTGGNATLLVSNTSTLGVTIPGFDQTSEIIDLTAIGNDGTISNFDTTNDLITVTGSSGSVTLQFDSIDGLSFTTSPDGGGTDLSIAACYCRGTLILTVKGEVAVEELAIGDRVVTFSGEAKPIKWIGHRAYDGRFVAGNRAMLPVRIAAGALADGVPARDLWVSPGHALYFDGVLVQAEQLVNGATITQETGVDRLEYFHIELEAHDILFATGAPAESYVDCDNRGKFHNAAEFAHLYPNDDRPHWQYCAPLLEWGSEEPNAIRAALIERAAALGHRLDLDPDLHLVVDGATIRPEEIDGLVYRFAIPAGSIAAFLASRGTVPAEVEAAARDRRRLGVPIERLVIYDATLRIEAGHGAAGLADGFHEDEATHRWTDGLARLPEAWLRAFPGAVTLEVHLIPSGLPYRLPHPARNRAAA